MNDPTNPWAYASLLAGGLLIVAGGLAAVLMWGAFGDMMDYGMMGDSMSYMTTGWRAAMAPWMGLVGLVAGGLVLYAAWRLRQDPADAVLVGTLGIVGGVLSLLSMGGWVVGAALAIVGGALALGQDRARPAPQRAQEP